jgi:hypothetical protein
MPQALAICLSVLLYANAPAQQSMVLTSSDERAGAQKNCGLAGVVVEALSSSGGGVKGIVTKEGKPVQATVLLARDVRRRNRADLSALKTLLLRSSVPVSRRA